MFEPTASINQKNEIIVSSPGEVSAENDSLMRELKTIRLFQQVCNRLLLANDIKELREATLETMQALFPTFFCGLRFFGIDLSRESLSTDDYARVANEMIGFPDKARNMTLVNLDKPRLDRFAPGGVPIDAQSNAVKVLLFPILIRNQIIGSIDLFLSKQLSVDSTTNVLTQLLSSQIGVAVENILAKKENAKRDLERDVLLASSSAIASNLDINVVIRTVCQHLKKVIDFNDIGVSRYDLTSMTYRILACDGDLVQAIPNFKLDSDKDFALKDGLHDVLFHSKEPIIFDYECLKALNKPQTNVSLAAGMRSVAGVRLVHNHKTIGALILTSNKDDAFSDKDLDLITRLSHHLATALSNAVAHQELTKSLEEIKKYKDQLQQENLYLHQQVQTGFSFKDIVGNGAAMQKVYNSLSQVSFTNSTVLILGETGTGKELIARAIHNSSARGDKLLVKVNCATLPAALIESELFGHERGSFTGAVDRRIGKFELANEGTLFLDEIGELPLDLQVKLLRAIQEREIERIGGKQCIKVDVRIIAATNRDLAVEVREGRFRSDLYYRLNVFPLLLPPLRERKEDIPDLARHFAAKFSRNTAKGAVKISSGALKELLSYSWPGNVRELEHQIERSVILADESVIRHFELPTLSNSTSRLSSAISFKTYEQNVRDHIIAVLNYCGGKIYGPGGAAQLLNLKVGTLNSKIRKLGINREDIIIQQFE